MLTGAITLSAEIDRSIDSLRLLVCFQGAAASHLQAFRLDLYADVEHAVERVSVHLQSSPLRGSR